MIGAGGLLQIAGETLRRIPAARHVFGGGAAEGDGLRGSRLTGPYDDGCRAEGRVVLVDDQPLAIRPGVGQPDEAAALNGEVPHALETIWEIMRRSDRVTRSEE